MKIILKAILKLSIPIPEMNWPHVWFILHKMTIHHDNQSLNCDIRENHMTRQSDLINIVRCDSTLSSSLPLYNFPGIWKKWIRVVPAYDSKNRFKGKIKSHILTYLTLIEWNVQIPIVNNVIPSSQSLIIVVWKFYYRNFILRQIFRQ